MQHTNPDTKPTLLMISDVVPNPRGNAAQSHAWQMLLIAHRTHTVHLAAYQDQRVNLQQWRTLSHFCGKIHLEPGQHHSDHLLGKLAISLHRTFDRSTQTRSPLTSAAEWIPPMIDALVVVGAACARPGMLPPSLHTQARLSVLVLQEQDRFVPAAQTYDILVTPDATTPLPLRRGPIIVLPAIDTTALTTPQMAASLTSGQGLSRLLTPAPTQPRLTIHPVQPRALAA